MAAEHTVRVVGWSAVLVELPDALAVQAWWARLQRRREDGLLAAEEIVPAAATVLLDGVADPERLAAEIAAWPAVAPLPAISGSLVEIPTSYDGPDLAEVAGYWGTTERGVVEVHTATEFRVAFAGFAPGFGYLTGLPDDRAVPRRATPRARVPAGSVALAGRYSGVYPIACPGGWQLIGQTELVTFDAARDPSALLVPGSRVRFVEIAR